MDMTLSELQEMASRQQQQIDSQQQLLASKVNRDEVQDERGDGREKGEYWGQEVQVVEMKVKARETE